MIQARFEHVDQECLFMGLVAPSGHRLLVPREVINEHMYICGQTGSGKTSLGFVPLLMQLGQPWLKAKRDDDGHFVNTADGRQIFVKQKVPPILIIDLKGDPALFNSARAIAAENGYAFKHFSIEPGRPGYIFDVFQNFAGASPLYLAEVVLLALGLMHGEGYGKSHYSRAHRARLSETFKKMGGRPILSWEQLFMAVQATQLPSAQDSDELLNAIHGMQFHEGLSADGRSPDNVGVIHMPTVLEQRQMLYFWLPAGIAPMSVREIGKLALYAFHDAAKKRADEGRKVQSYVFIDEFHMLAGRNMEQLLTQGRSAGMAMVLANQYSGRLTEEELDLRRMVYECTRLKQYFTLTDPKDIDELTRASGETVRWLSSASSSSSESYNFLTGTTVGQSQQQGSHQVMCPRFDVDLPRQVTNDPLGSIVWIQRGSGYSQFGGVPQWVQSLWPISNGEYKARNGFDKYPWPKPQDNPPTAAAKTAAKDTPRAKLTAAKIQTKSDIMEQLAEQQEKKSGAGRKPTNQGKKKTLPEPPGDDLLP